MIASSSSATPSWRLRTCGRTGTPCAGRTTDEPVVGTECNHRTMHVRCVQRVERPPAGLRRCHDDRLQRIAKRGFDRRLPAGVDVDEVEQRAENILHAGQVLGARASPGALQRKVQCLGSGTPSRRVVSCRLAGQRSGFVRGLGRDAASLGGLEVGNQAGLDDAAPARIPHAAARSRRRAERFAR